MTSKIALIGGGRMASALVGGMIKNGFEKANLHVYDPNSEQCNLLRGKFGIHASSVTTDIPADVDCVIWAVKPQSMRLAAQPFAANFASALHISIAAGVRIKTLQVIFQSRRVIRVMPNTPALIGTGVTALFPSEEVTDLDKTSAELILKATGYTFWVANDERMDAVTALTGSGPGYVFHFVEGLMKAAQTLGFNAKDARKLCLLTMQGAVSQALDSQESIESLRHAVTSPGGTTEAGLSVMTQWRVQDAMVAASQSAYARAIELGEEYDLPDTWAKTVNQ